MLRTVGRSWGLLSRRQKTALVLLTMARVSANALDVLGISIFGAVGALALGVDFPVPFLDETNIQRETLVVLLLAVATAVFASKTLLGIALARRTMLYLAAIETLFSVQVASSIFSGSLSHLRKKSRPEIDWAILRSTNNAFTGVLGQAIAFLAEATLALGIFGFLFFTDWPSAIAVTLYFSIILGIFHIYSQRKLSSAGAAYAESSVSVNESITSLTNAFKEISVQSKTPVFIEVLAESRGKVARAQAIDSYLAAVPRLIVELAIIAGAVAFVAFQYANGDGLSNLAFFGVFLISSLRMMSALLPLQRAFQFIRFVKPLAEAAQDFLWDLKSTPQTPTRTSRVATPPGPEDLGPATDFLHGIRVVLEKVSFEYDDTDEPTAVLQDISLTIERGSTVALIGPSGAGKSTLVDLILGLINPTAGEVQCAGMSPLTLRTLNPGSVGYVPQKPGLISGSLEENIALGVPAGQVDEVALWDAIKVARLTDLVTSLPGGVKSSVGKQSDSLSGGQIQRLGLARALYTRPSLLVLDEATSALDAETEAAISESLALLKGNTTLITVAHRLSTIQNADMIHVLDEGRVIASGPFQALRKGNPLVKKYVALMSFDD